MTNKKIALEALAYTVVMTIFYAFAVILLFIMPKTMCIALAFFGGMFFAIWMYDITFNDLKRFHDGQKENEPE